MGTKEREERWENQLCVECGVAVGPDNVRCDRCAAKHADSQKDVREKRKMKGYCPQCGRVKLAKGQKSCLRCMLKVSEERGDDFVHPITKSRNWPKRLKED